MQTKTYPTEDLMAAVMRGPDIVSVMSGSIAKIGLNTIDTVEKMQKLMLLVENLEPEYVEDITLALLFALPISYATASAQRLGKRFNAQRLGQFVERLAGDAQPIFAAVDKEAAAESGANTNN